MRFILISFFLLLGVISFGQTSLGKNKKAPAFSLKDTYGAVITPNSFKGKVLYIDLWATWCKPCLEGHKSFNQLINRFKDHKNEIAFLGVSIDESEELWKKTLRKQSLKGIQVIAENGGASKIISDYNISRFPHYILIDKNGNLVNANAPKPDSKELEEILSSLLPSFEQYRYTLIENKKAPTFSLRDPYGVVINPNSFRGKVLYINVWASWCKSCSKDRKSFNQLFNKFKESKHKNEVAFMSVSVDDSEASWRKAMRKRPLKGTQVMAENGITSQIISDYNIKVGDPHYILIDKNGNLVDANAPKPNSKELEEMLDELLK